MTSVAPSTRVGTDAAAGRSRSRRTLGYSLSSLAAAVAVGTGHVLRNRFQHRRMFKPDRYPNGIWNPAAYGLPAEDRWFYAPDGEELHGWWIPHPKPRGTILYCHGNTGSIADRIGVFDFLRRLRVDLFVFDYRGYGRSSGRPTEKGVFADARAAYDHLVETLGRDPSRILLFGHSLGGAVAVDCALDRPVAGLVVQSSFTDTRQMARVLYPDLPLHWIARRQFRSIDKVGRLTMPKLFIHGGEDGTIPAELGRRLFEAAVEPKDFYLVPRANHNDLHRQGGLAYLRRLGRFRNLVF